jgi:hypothetical protein
MRVSTLVATALERTTRTLSVKREHILREMRISTLLATALNNFFQKRTHSKMRPDEVLSTQVALTAAALPKKCAGTNVHTHARAHARNCARALSLSHTHPRSAQVCSQKFLREFPHSYDSRGNARMHT